MSGIDCLKEKKTKLSEALNNRAITQPTSQTKKFSVVISHIIHAKEPRIRKEVTVEEVLHTRLVSD